MAELTHFEDSDDTLFVNTTGTNVWKPTGVKILGSALTAGTKYLVLARGLFANDSAALLGGIGVETSSDSTLLSNTFAVQEPMLSTSVGMTAYFAASSFTTHATTPTDVDMVIWAGGSNNTQWIDQQTLILIDLDAIGTEGIDYYEDKIAAADAGSDLVRAGSLTMAQLSGSDLGTDEWVVFGMAKFEVGNTGHWGKLSVEAAVDTSTSSVVALHQREGEDANEDVTFGFTIRHKASSGTPNVTILGERQDSGGGAHSDEGSYLIALPTSLFADFVWDYEAALILIDSTEKTVATTGSYTPTITGNHLIFGRAGGTSTPTNYGRLWVDSTTTEIRPGDEPITQNQIWDQTKDNEQTITFQRYSITTAETFNLQAQSTNNYDLAHRWLIVINLNEPASGAAIIKVEGESMGLTEGDIPLVSRIRVEDEAEGITEVDIHVVTEKGLLPFFMTMIGE